MALLWDVPPVERPYITFWDVPLGFDGVSYDYDHDSDTGFFNVVAEPADFYPAEGPDLSLPEGPDPLYVLGEIASLEIHIHVDASGNLIGGVPDQHDLVLLGDIDLEEDDLGDIDFDGDGIEASNVDPQAVVASALLTGDIVAFGFRDAGATDLYDFRFDVTGGALAGYFEGKEIGLTIGSESSTTFTGSFAESFHGEAKGELWPYGPQEPGIDIEKYVKRLDDQGGGEGLTPGYWKQCQHFGDWTGYLPSHRYETIFGVDVDGPCWSPTLLDALSAGGGGVNALLRHSAAALLNAAHPNIDYAYTEAEIIAMVQGAFASGDYETVKDLFEFENEKGADLTDGSSGTAIPDDYGVDADDPTGPTVDVGEQVVFTYVVTNPGKTELANVVVTDDNETPGDTPPASDDDFNPTPVEDGGFNVGDLDQDGRLDPGEEWLYTATKTVTAGQHVNWSDVVGTPVDEGGNTIGDDVTDKDPAHWLGEEPVGVPAIDIEKLTNGVNADNEGEGP